MYNHRNCPYTNGINLIAYGARVYYVHALSDTIVLCKLSYTVCILFSWTNIKSPHHGNCFQYEGS